MLRRICKSFLIAIVLLSTEHEAARILAVIGTPSISHQVVYRPLFHELARRGHDVTIVTTDPAFDKENVPENITEIDLHDISYKIWRSIFSTSALGTRNGFLSQIHVILQSYDILFEKQVTTHDFQEILKKPNDYYDLIFLESCYNHYMVLSHVFDAPVVLVSSFGPVFSNLDVIGAPEHPILNWPLHRQRLYNLTFREKFNELYVHYSLKYYINSYIKNEDRLIRKLFGPDVPSVVDLNNNVDMFFLNANPITEGNQPMPPNVVHLYGIHCRKFKKDLPYELEDYLNKSANGVIYVSFGTNADPAALPKEKIQVLTNVFAKLPYNILWKWNTDQVPSNARNIRFAKWFPQYDLLRHPKIKLFIMQGGLQSIEESINVGVPMIGIPMLGDQWMNTEKFKMFNIGEKIDLEDLDEDILTRYIDKVIGDESYRRSIEKLRGLVADEMESPLERAVWWSEYVIRHKGAKHLRSPYANISWWDYLELDFVLQLQALFTFTFSICFIVLFVLVRTILNVVIKKENKLKSN